ncbi:myosin-17-like [Eutrema salsugineum]|uniref:myosin-17-like n=1 Tax=Eutrema salsugineum TaxID=72664 RepID=UPI000CED4F9F|nr:myosin-17-like [Eutrema salsugineum]
MSTPEAMQETQFQVEESNAAVIREGEAARKAIEKSPPFMKDTPVLVEDTEKINSLTSEMEAIKEHQELLVKCISQNLGYAGGKPVAACVIYKCLLHWRSFEVERTSVFNRIIQTIASAIEVPDNNEVLAYWLSNSATLLLLLQRTLKATGAASLTPQRRRTTSSSLFVFLFLLTQRLRGSPQSAGLSSLNRQELTKLDGLRQVEAKYPALLFKQQLTAFLEKIYGMIRDNLKKDISPLLALCIQAPRTSMASLVKGRAQENAVVQQALIAHWQSIRKSLNTYLNLMKANNVPPFLVSKVFTQIFSFINVQLLNSLLLRRECCSFSNGKYVEAGLAELKLWCIEATDEYAGSAWDELRHIRQAVAFLVIPQKQEKTLDKITRELCPVLSIQQLYRISTMYWDDKYGTHSVSSDVSAKMRVIMTEDSNNAVSSSFLLDDDSSIPFAVEDISMSVQQLDVNNVEPPQLIRENAGFSFLLTREEGSSS